MRRRCTVCAAIFLAACTSLPHDGAIASSCEFKLTQFDDAKANIIEQSENRHPNDVTVKIGETEQTIPLGQLVGFNGDYILQMHISIPADCEISEELKTTLNSEHGLQNITTEMTILWSSWKDERIEVISDYTGDLRDYFTPPMN